MSVMIRNLVPTFLERWEQAVGKPHSDRLALLSEYATRYPEMVSDVTRDGGRPDLIKHSADIRT